jgi:hypothetical protein
VLLVSWLISRSIRSVKTSALLSALVWQGCSETTDLVLRPEGEVDASVARDADSDKSEVSPITDSANASDAADVIVDACKTCSGSIVLNLSNAVTSMLWGGDGGRQFPPDRCGVGEAVVGYQGTVNGNTLVNNDAAVAVIGSIQAMCGRLLSDDSATTVTWVQSASLPVRGTPTTMFWFAQCNTDEVVVALKGGYGDAFDQIDVICGKIQLAPATGGKVVTVDPTAGRLVGQAGGDGFGATYDFSCGKDKIVIGSVVHAGLLIDAFGVICATPTFVPFDGGSKCCALGMD